MQAYEAEQDQARRTRLATERRVRDFGGLGEYEKCPRCGGKGLVLKVHTNPQAAREFIEAKGGVK